jgi:hypothetical protein
MRQKPFSIVLFAVSALALFGGCDSRRSSVQDRFSRVIVPAGVAAEKSVLVLSGRIAGGAPVQLALDTLLKFPSTSFTTTDPWDQKEHRFEGVLLHPLLVRFGMDAEAALVEVSAANGYQATIRVQDLRRYGHLLAYRMDGALTSTLADLTKRGALQIALDFQGQPGLSPDLYKHQLVWQVVRITVR